MKQRLLLTIFVGLSLIMMPVSTAQNVTTYQGTYFPETEEAGFDVEFDDRVLYVIVDNTGAMSGDTDRSTVNFNIDVDITDFDGSEPLPPPVDTVITTISGIGNSPTYSQTVDADDYYYVEINQNFSGSDSIRRISADFESDNPATFFLTNSTGYENFLLRIENIPEDFSLNFNFYFAFVGIISLTVLIKLRKNK